MPRGDELAVLACERAVVHREFHLNRRRINRDVRQRRTHFAVGDGFTDENLLEARDAHDVARVRLVDLDALHALEVVEHGDLAFGNLASAMTTNRRITHLDLAFVNFPERDTSEVIGVIQVRDEQLKTFARFRTRRRDVFHNRVEQRLHRAADVIEFHLGVTFLGRAIDERKIQLLIRRIERHEQLEHLIEHLLGVCVLAVNLVDDHDGLRTGFERLAQHEARLRLRAFGRIHDEQHTVNHVHDALHLAAEVGVSGSVHDVDVVILVFERGVLGADGDALLLFEVHRIHQPHIGGLVLVGAEGAGLFEETVHERGLAVVNVRDDRDVSYVLHIVNGHCRFIHAA